MSLRVDFRRSTFAVFWALSFATANAVVAFEARPTTSRFDALVVVDETQSLDVATTPVFSLPSTERLRGAWDGFRNAYGPAWSVYLDRRSGAPMLAFGQGIPWAVDATSTVDSLALSLRPFMAEHRALLLARNGELVLDKDASGLLSPDVWQIVFSRAIAGVPVDGERFVFTIGHGNLISFGAPRWSRIDASPFPDIDASEALMRLTSYMRLNAKDGVTIVDTGSLHLIALRAASTRAPAALPYAGPVGSGYASALVWRITLKVAGEPGTWRAQVDAHTGEIRSFTDINEYAQAKGGVYPNSNDQIPPDGVEQAGWPMPYASITIGANAQTTSALGFFNCTPGGSTAATTLAGPYIKVVDFCGPVSQSVTCDGDLDLQSGAGTDCVVPDGATAGNTHASRTGFYHLNRIAEHARAWLPSRTWLTQQLTDNVNLNQTCNAYWDGTSINFFKSGGGCANTGELPGVFLHEWGHGLDQNDGGGFDNPSEAYADITALMATHASCVGRGFTAGNCTGYGDSCLDCTGIRDMDYAKHASNLPATPSGFLTTYCGSGPGNGPCGKEVHCEAHVGAETLWDLATRDLPATGLDLASSWQLADKLWYKSRLGSGGNAYTCALPNSDGCAVTSWFAKLRTVDDDDGNLANGTPHAAAIFAAFNRHKIACGAENDLSNQNSTTCPAIGAPILAMTAGSGAAQLTWAAVANAAAYNVLRSDASCLAGSTIVATIPGTTFNDTGLPNGFTEYYSVQAVGANATCDGPLSNCQAATPQPFVGLVRLDAGTYSCFGVITVTVTDGNAGAGPVTVTIASATEPGGETISLSRSPPGSATYVGTISATSGAAAADGMISLAEGDTITATYIDANDGHGGVNQSRTTLGATDCVVPVITNVASSNITGISAHVTWDTNEASTSVVHYGLTPPPGSATNLAARVVGHGVDLTGLAECATYVYAVESTDAVGNTALDNNGGAYYTFGTGKNTTPSFASTDGPVPIPDATPAGASSTIVIPDNKTIQNVKVTLNLTHTFDGDLVITLVPPVGSPITLSNRRGSLGQNFINTIFDDAAETPIGAGGAPFTGSFNPETPLAAAIGINAAGAWQLHVVDAAGFDTGTIDTWTLTLTYPAAVCGPHAGFQSFAPVADTCGAGGAGNADANWDPGEQVSFKVRIGNDGTTILTGVTATVTSTTPGVVMQDGTASFPNIPAATAADSLAPHVTALLPPGLSCGGTVSFQVSIASNQGSWSGGSFTHGVGLVTPGGATALDETFSGGIPATWTVVDGGSGGGAAATWTTANPGGRAIAAPMSSPVATIDSDNAGFNATQDEHLITPALSLQTATSVTLQFDQFFHRWGNEIADLDVQSTLTGGVWVNVLRQQGASSLNPDHRSLNISAQAAGASNVKARFHYHNASYDFFWQIDNVKVDTTAPGGCTQNVCIAPPGIAKPVADGSFGTPMKASRANVAGSIIDLTWDVATCSSTDHHVLFGDLASVAQAAVGGSVCDLGTSGSASWAGGPAGNLWFVVVGDDNAAKEGSWGTASAGERGGAVASGRCGMTARDNSGTCP